MQRKPGPYPEPSDGEEQACGNLAGQTTCCTQESLRSIRSMYTALNGVAQFYPSLIATLFTDDTPRLATDLLCGAAAPERLSNPSELVLDDSAAPKYSGGCSADNVKALRAGFADVQAGLIALADAVQSCVRAVAVYSEGVACLGCNPQADSFFKSGKLDLATSTCDAVAAPCTSVVTAVESVKAVSLRFAVQLTDNLPVFDDTVKKFVEAIKLEDLPQLCATSGTGDGSCRQMICTGLINGVFPGTNVLPNPTALLPLVELAQKFKLDQARIGQKPLPAVYAKPSLPVTFNLPSGQQGTVYLEVTATGTAMTLGFPDGLVDAFGEQEPPASVYATTDASLKMQPPSTWFYRLDNLSQDTFMVIGGLTAGQKVYFALQDSDATVMDTVTTITDGVSSPGTAVPTGFDGVSFALSTPEEAGPVTTGPSMETYSFTAGELMLFTVTPAGSTPLMVTLNGTTAGADVVFGSKNFLGPIDDDDAERSIIATANDFTIGNDVLCSAGSPTYFLVYARDAASFNIYITPAAAAAVADTQAAAAGAAAARAAARAARITTHDPLAAIEHSPLAAMPGSGGALLLNRLMRMVTSPLTHRVLAPVMHSRRLAEAQAYLLTAGDKAVVSYSGTGYAAYAAGCTGNSLCGGPIGVGGGIGIAVAAVVVIVIVIVIIRRRRR
eukprot:PLAT12543.16.p1 GENE.PLAT12543.16~~PLAT12543.16.p1  ORF type:complete len:670 (+),score=341.75 PLAT12543.16:729-2738(+)